MRLEDFDYQLPEGLIAQEPASRRSDARLLVLGGEGEAPRHSRFAELPELLRDGDLLVLNDARVFPARLLGRKPTGGRAEVLLAARLDEGGPEAREQEWEALLGGSRPPRAGGRVEVASELRVEVIEGAEGDRPARIRLLSEGPVDRAVDRWGRIPLPPYIRRREDDPREAMDRERYQTVYARRRGAAAAPTAGLHFTPELLEGLRSRGVRTATLTLEVGLGTFRPITAARVEDHPLHAERYRLEPETVQAVTETRARGGRVVAVGTTVVRTLEHAAREGSPRAGEGWCDLFIVPGYRFRVVDAVLTNFHLPRSSLLVLVSAFSGRERVLAAYREAVREGYRFYSYGDATLLLGPRPAEREARP
jgi:S-adenosylmethionine:tRNA ribosyltransferase-isomerase